MEQKPLDKVHYFLGRVESNRAVFGFADPRQGQRIQEAWDECSIEEKKIARKMILRVCPNWEFKDSTNEQS